MAGAIVVAPVTATATAEPARASFGATVIANVARRGTMTVLNVAVDPRSAIPPTRSMTNVGKLRGAYPGADAVTWYVPRSVMSNV